MLRCTSFFQRAARSVAAPSVGCTFAVRYNTTKAASVSQRVPSATSLKQDGSETLSAKSSSSAESGATTAKANDVVSLTLGRHEQLLSRPNCVRRDEIYDCIIVGGGVTGTALLYELATFTDLKKVALVEKRRDVSQIASDPRNNSQTIHCGDIETNYTATKAALVSRQANMLRNFATKLPADVRDKVVIKMPKMVLGVGDAECDFLEERYKPFKEIFPNLKMMNKKQVKDQEPMVVLRTHYDERPERINALGATDEHSAVDYYELAKAFIGCALDNTDKTVDVCFGNEVEKIEPVGDMFRVKVGGVYTTTKTVVVSACGHSLLLAQQMGFASEFSCLPVAGSFYFTKQTLNGKVYTCQDPALPFAAVHGDADVVAHGKTRFGPTALPLPLLERYNKETFWDFMKVLNFDTSLIHFYIRQFGQKERRNYLMRNLLFEVPYLNSRLFSKDVKKIVPSITAKDLSYANGYGGVRPQLVNKTTGQLLMGEGKINPDCGIIFNVTPSPGGTTCLGTGEGDMRYVCERLGNKINEEKFKRVLLEGEYPVINA